MRKNAETQELQDRVAVVVPVLNEEETLRACLEAILAQDYPCDRVEILVVDGLSTDRSPEIVAELQKDHPQIRLLRNPQRIVSAAMNIGVRHAKEADVILRVDGRTILAPDYIRRCVEYLHRTGADNVGGLMRPTGSTYVGRAIAMTMQSPLAVGDAKFRYAQEDQEVDTVYLGAFRREVFERVGLYDETLVRNQDYELNYRIRSHGGRVFLSPSIRSTYLVRDSLMSFARQYLDYGYWKAQMIRKHPRSIRPRQMAPPLLVLGLTVSSVLAPLFRPFAYLLALLLSSYLSLALIFALTTARRHGWRYLPILPLTFAIMHLSWGLGFLWGLVHPAKAPSHSS